MSDDVLRQLVLPKLERVRRQGGYWMAQCPAHEDNKASLSVQEGTEQPVLLNCFAGCEPQAIVAALGLTWEEVCSPNGSKPRGEWTPYGDAIAVYSYIDAQGEQLFQVLRTAGKQFPQRHMGTDGKWIWRMEGVTRVPYRLPKVIEAVKAGQPVYVVEGEKDVHSVERAGGAATCSPGGAGKWRDEYDHWFKGAEVLIVADADEPGRKHADDVLAHLRPLARSVAIFESAVGKDVTDHLDAGRTLAELVPQGRRTSRFAIVELEPATDFAPAPTLICRDKLYLGAVHTLSGPPDCGKTTLACWWMLQVVRDGGNVLFLDEEGGRDIVIEKFQALGAQPGERISYLPFPSCSWDNSDIEDLNALLDERKPTMVAWDSAAQFLARANLDENAAPDVTRFYSQVLTPAARQHGSAVLVIDHDVKNGGETSRYSRGSGAKLAATDVMYKVGIVTPFSRTESGASRLLVSKDRRGWLTRAYEVAFTADLRAGTLIVSESRAAGAPAGLQQIEQWVLEALGVRPAPWTDLVERIQEKHGKRYGREYINRTLKDLERMGLAGQVGTSETGYILWVLA